MKDTKMPPKKIVKTKYSPPKAVAVVTPKMKSPYGAATGIKTPTKTCNLCGYYNDAHVMVGCPPYCACKKLHPVPWYGNSHQELCPLFDVEYTAEFRKWFSTHGVHLLEPYINSGTPWTEEEIGWVATAFAQNKQAPQGYSEPSVKVPNAEMLALKMEKIILDLYTDNPQAASPWGHFTQQYCKQLTKALMGVLTNP